MITVLCNGCFDLLHPGHIEHLEEAAGHGDRLVVALTLDEFVGKGPGRPLIAWEGRARMLRPLAFVDAVLPSRNGAEAIRQVHPQVFCKGPDWFGRLPPETVLACHEVGAVIVCTTAPKMSTTDLIQRIKDLA